MFYIIYVIDQCFSDVLNQDGPYNVTTYKYDLAVHVLGTYNYDISDSTTLKKKMKKIKDVST